MMKEKEMKRVPKLRFPEFTDDWEQRKVSEVAEICTGGTPSTGIEKYWYPKEIPWLSSGEVHKKYITYTDNKISVEGMNNSSARMIPENSVLIALAGQGKTRGTVAINRISLTTNQSIAAMTFSNEIVPEFVFCNLENRYEEIRRMSSGDGSRGGLNKQIVGEIEIPYTSKEEQTKIGAYFSTLDHLITLHQRKLEKLKELRKGVMKKLFNQEVRFKADDESEFPEWEKKKIGDVFSQIKDKNKDGRNQNVITNSAEFGLINQRDFFDKDIAVDGKTENYTVIKTGDFVYNPRKSKQAPYGPFNCYQLEENGIVSPLYTCLRPKSNVNDKYLLWYFKSGSWYRFIYENGAQNGARHDRVGMTDSLMQEIPVYLPQAVEEQQKIADCLSTLDDVIEKQKETLAAWEELKKGLLQQMFV